MILLRPRKFLLDIIRKLSYGSYVRPTGYVKREDTVLIHGGAGDYPEDEAKKKLDGIITAVNEAYQVLQRTENVLDAVEVAVRIMERDENFNAGYGSRLTSDGYVEMDASIMSGSELQGAGVAAIRNIKHPITLAKIVMMKTPYSLLVGEGAMKFAKDNGVKILPPDKLVSKQAKALWEKTKSVDANECGTVGCVAIDKLGNLAAGSSSGGVNRRFPGKFSDSAGIGAGTFADNTSGAVACSGHGDSVSKLCLAFSIANLVNTMSPVEAINVRLARMKDRLNTNAGAIALSKKGSIGIACTTKLMPWAYKIGRIVHYGINPDEQFETKL